MTSASALLASASILAVLSSCRSLKIVSSLPSLVDDTTGPVFSGVDFGEDSGDDKLSWTGEASLVVGLGDDEDADELPVEVFSVGLAEILP